MVATPIEDLALLSNCRTAALVSREGDVEWLCLPRLDSASVFAALLGDTDDGSWRLRPSETDAWTERRYDGDTFVLVTRWETPTGVAEVHDFMPVGSDQQAAIDRTDLVRRVVGISGTVDFDVDLRLRFDYARALPWVRQTGSKADPELIAMHKDTYMPMIGTAEVVAKRYNISRELQDEYSLQSQQRTAAAQAAGKYDDEIIACPATMAVVNKETKEVTFKDVVADKDECNRADTTLEGLASLKPVMGEGHTITAGNASQLADGSSACVVLEAKVAEKRGLQPLGRLRRDTLHLLAQPGRAAL